MNRRLGWEIERVILGIIIILGILDFAGQLPPFFAYVMDLIGWTLIAYIIYVISPTEIIFGEKHTRSDLFIILSYVIMSIKDLIGQAAATLPELIATSPSYLRLSVTNISTGMPFAITQEELNAFQLFSVVPSRVVEAVAPHITMTQQQFGLLLVHTGESIGLLATPTGHNGMMLMYYNSLLQHAAMLQKWSLIIGMLMLLGVSIYAAYRIPVQKPSMLSVLKEEGQAGASHIFWVFLILTGFFVIVFNLLFEWMTITNDAPLIALAALVLGTLFLIHHIHLSFDEMIERLGTLGDELYARVVHLFMQSRTILLGISGFLVLHLLTDVGNYVAPSIFGWYETIYVRNTPGDHTPLAEMIQASWSADPIANAMLIATVVFSTAGIILLLSLPAIIWYKLMKIRHDGHEHLPDWKGWQIGFVLGCIAVFLIAPVFDLSPLYGSDIVGVNLTSLAVGNAQLALGVAAIILLFCTVVGAVNDYARRVLMLGPFGAAILFFGIYVYYYFLSSFAYYATTLVGLVRSGEYLLVPIMLVLFSLTIIFFITGFLSFLYEIWRE